MHKYQKLFSTDNMSKTANIHYPDFKMIILLSIVACFLFCVPTLAVTNTNIQEGYYYIYPVCSSTKSLTVKNNSKKAKANIYLYKNSAKSKQMFYISKVASNTYIIKNKMSDKIIEAVSKKDKANIRQNTYKKKKTQKWRFTKKGNAYIIRSAVDSNMVITVDGSLNINKANIYLYENQNKKGQRFILKSVQAKTKSKQTNQSQFQTAEKSPNVQKDDTVSSVGYTATDKLLKSIKNYTKSTRKWTLDDYKILTNIIGAVESGGQVYGQRDYASYAEPGANTSNEVTITLGWGQFYGSEAQTLIYNIYTANKTAFEKIDKKGLIQKALNKDWVKNKWHPNNSEKATLIQLISSETGKKCQDELFEKLMETFVNDCKHTYTDNAYATFMYCEIRHLGGASAVKRIFTKCKKDYSLKNIMSCLILDRLDKSSNTQVGDELFWSRHEKCCEFIAAYAK